MIYYKVRVEQYNGREYTYWHENFIPNGTMVKVPLANRFRGELGVGRVTSMSFDYTGVTPKKIAEIVQGGLTTYSDADLEAELERRKGEASVAASFGVPTTTYREIRDYVLTHYVKGAA